MPANYDNDRLFVFDPPLDIGLRAGAFEGYGNVTQLDQPRKRGALETWMSNVKHEATSHAIGTVNGGVTYLDFLSWDLEKIGRKDCQTKSFWQKLRLVVNSNNDRANKYNDQDIKTHLEKFNQYWNSEHKSYADWLSKKPYKEQTGQWNVVHCNQQPGLAKLLAADILIGNKLIYNGHKYLNEQGRGGILPKRKGGYWAFDYNTGKTSRGAARVVIGPVNSPADQTREVWFTDNHYSTFVRVVGGHRLVREAH